MQSFGSKKCFGRQSTSFGEHTRLVGQPSFVALNRRGVFAVALTTECGRASCSGSAKADVDLARHSTLVGRSYDRDRTKAPPTRSRRGSARPVSRGARAAAQAKKRPAPARRPAKRRE